MELVSPNARAHWILRSGSVVKFRWSDLCVPGMGMILWGESPLYIIRKGVIVDNFKKY